MQSRRENRKRRALFGGMLLIIKEKEKKEKERESISVSGTSFFLEGKRKGGKKEGGLFQNDCPSRRGGRSAREKKVGEKRVFPSHTASRGKRHACLKEGEIRKPKGAVPLLGGGGSRPLL